MMNKYNILLFTILLISNSTSAIVLDEYIYTGYTVEISYLDNGDIYDFNSVINELYIDTNDQIIKDSSSGVYYHVCKERNDIYCLIGGGINLAIPMAKNNWPNKWFDSFAEYNYLGRKYVKMFGKNYVVEIITRKSVEDSNAGHNTHEVYYYSINDGLIGFSVYYNDDEIISNYYSAQRKGIRLDLLSKYYRDTQANNPDAYKK